MHGKWGLKVKYNKIENVSSLKTENLFIKENNVQTVQIFKQIG